MLPHAVVYYGSQSIFQFWTEFFYGHNYHLKGFFGHEIM